MFSMKSGLNGYRALEVMPETRCVLDRHVRPTGRADSKSEPLGASRQRLSSLGQSGVLQRPQRRKDFCCNFHVDDIWIVAQQAFRL